MAETTDAIIIGAGIIGTSIALELARRGRRTLNIDKNPAAGYGSTSNSSAVIRTFYSTLEGSSFALEGLNYWRDWRAHVGAEDGHGLARFVNTGCLVIKTPENDGLRPICGIMDTLGIPWEDWNRAILADKLPFLDLHRFAPVRLLDDPRFGERQAATLDGAIFFPDGGYVNDPQLTAQNVQSAAESAGAAFRFNKKVVEIRQSGGQVVGVTLDDGEQLDAAVVVNAAGPHSGVINRMAGVEDGMAIKTRPLRQEVAYLPLPRDLPAQEFGPMIADGDVGCYCRADTGDKILIGTLEPECDALEWIDDPDDFDRNHTEQWTAQAYRMAQRIPDLPIPNQSAGVVDLYDVSDDWIPIYDRSDLDGFFMAVGTSGNQFKNAPVAGALMAALIEYSSAGGDHDRDPLQFTLRRTGRTINAGFFSRRRSIARDSSMTVIG